MKFRRTKLEEELGQLIGHIEEISTVTHILEGRTPRPSVFPPQNPFQDMPIRRINTETYLRIARTFISQPGNPQGFQRTPGAGAPVLIIELNQRIREVSRLISTRDQEVERLETETRNITREIAQHIRDLQSDRDKLAGELQFYKDLKETLENRPVSLSREEIQEQRNRARDWADARRDRG